LLDLGQTGCGLVRDRRALLGPVVVIGVARWGGVVVPIMIRIEPGALVHPPPARGLTERAAVLLLHREEVVEVHAGVADGHRRGTEHRGSAVVALVVVLVVLRGDSRRPGVAWGGDGRSILHSDTRTVLGDVHARPVVMARVSRRSS